MHDAILEDLVFPSEIVGKRIRVKLDGSQLIKVHLDKAQQNNVEHKVGAAGGRCGAGTRQNWVPEKLVQGRGRGLRSQEIGSKLMPWFDFQKAVGGV